MAATSNSRTEMRQLWSEYEATLWAGLAAVKNQDTVTALEIDQLNAAHRRALKILSRLRELTAA